MAIKRSKVSFAATINGVPQVVNVGRLVEDGDPLLKGREHLFETVETHMAARTSGVEQATADPGEKRGITRARQPRKPKEQKPAAKAEEKPAGPAEDKKNEDAGGKS